MPDSIAPDAPVIESPPLAHRPPPTDPDEPRARLQKLVRELTRVHNRRLLIEYLQLRRSLR